MSSRSDTAGTHGVPIQPALAASAMATEQDSNEKHAVLTMSLGGNAPLFRIGVPSNTF
jgi:hypothetical protein